MNKQINAKTRNGDLGKYRSSKKITVNFTTWKVSTNRTETIMTSTLYLSLDFYDL